MSTDIDELNVTSIAARIRKLPPSAEINDVAAEAIEMLQRNYSRLLREAESCATECDAANATLARLQADVARLTEERDAAVKDAERLKWAEHHPVEAMEAIGCLWGELRARIQGRMVQLWLRH